jgi:CDP-diacylglycerol--serine O-phosphatidyltransferase
MSIVRHIPNAITSLNLLSGALALVSAWGGDLTAAAFWVMLASVLDFADGFAARLLHAYSDMGKELDSLADVVSFGLAPATILYLMLRDALSAQGVVSFEVFSPGWWRCLPALLPAVFAALRLARFNLHPGGGGSFQGLPTPAFALFVCALPFAATSGWFFAAWLSAPWVLWALIAFFCFLMVSNLPMFTLKFSSYAFVANKLRYIFLLVSLVLLLVFAWTALAWIILLYVLLSVLQSISGSTRQTA